MQRQQQRLTQWHVYATRDLLWLQLAPATAFGQGRHQWLPLQSHGIFTSVYS